ncbi:NAD(P)-binding domain-containing protein [Myxococcus sp. MISCRS1]|uniref:NADPH-dependent F420 reductase n=1 Tax=Myxococcus sp. MISCRS1 TaxID=2996786 RepID=UPI00226FF92D|nr:NAD(P)-binding domain-containing protein [Myxococcus sp. MISCRS1]MCY0995582.1 NAD(P)-binding domain-containing protein [Myxococcus sp. MISCRS1]
MKHRHRSARRDCPACHVVAGQAVASRQTPCGTVRLRERWISSGQASEELVIRRAPSVGSPHGRLPSFQEAHMKIGIIGAGHIGATLARKWVKLGHQVSLANSRGPDSIRELAAEIGATAVTAAQAAKSGEVVVVTIPQRAVMDLPKDLFQGVPADVVIIDTGNYYPTRDGAIPELEQGKTESVWVSERLGRPVVKAFNNIYSQSLADKSQPPGTPGRVALPVAGAPEAKAKVLRLIDELGFDPVDAGDLEGSWRQQPGTPCYTQDLDAPKLKAALAASDRGRIPEYRKAADDAAKPFFLAAAQRKP